MIKNYINAFLDYVLFFGYIWLYSGITLALHLGTTPRAPYGRPQFSNVKGKCSTYYNISLKLYLNTFSKEMRSTRTKSSYFIDFSFCFQELLKYKWLYHTTHTVNLRYTYLLKNLLTIKLLHRFSCYFYSIKVNIFCF